MPSYKLTYFNLRGRAERARLLFAAAGVKYEDVRLTHEQWKEQKGSSKSGMLPQLEIDGKVFAQSHAIVYFLAREFGFYPTNHMEQLAVDEILFLMHDMVDSAYKALFDKDNKEEKMKEFKEKELGQHLANLEKIYAENGSGDFMVGNKMSIADIAMYDAFSQMREPFENPLAEHQSLIDVVDRVGGNDKIKAWVESSPKTKF